MSLYTDDHLNTTKVTIYNDTTTSAAGSVNLPSHLGKSGYRRGDFRFQPPPTSNDESWMKSWCMIVLGTQTTLGLVLLLTGVLLAINGDCIYLFGHLVLANLVFTTAGLLFWGYTARRYEVLLYSMAAMVTAGSVFLFVSVIIMMWLMVVAHKGYGQIGWLPAGCWAVTAIIQLALALPIRQAMIVCRREYKSSISGTGNGDDQHSLTTNSTSNHGMGSSIYNSASHQHMGHPQPSGPAMPVHYDTPTGPSYSQPPVQYENAPAPAPPRPQQQPLLNTRSVHTEL